MSQLQLDWIPQKQSDTALNDSDKSFTVPANRVWIVQWIWVELISTSDAGNRQITIQFQDNTSDVICEVRAGAVQAASVTRNYMFAPHLSDLTSFRDTTFLMTPLPNIILPQNYIVRVYDSTAVAATADDMVVHMMVNQYGQA